MAGISSASWIARLSSGGATASRAGCAILIFLAVIGLSSLGCLQETPGAVGPQEETQLVDRGEEVEEGERQVSPLLPIGDFISELLIERYRTEVEGKEPSLKEGSLVRVLGRVEDFRVSGTYPNFRGEVDLKPYYCNARLQCVFEGELAQQLRTLHKDKDIVIEGKYGGVECHEFGRDVYHLIGCRLVSVENPQAWTQPVSDEARVGAAVAEYLCNWGVQTKLRQGKEVRVYGRIYSTLVGWGYLEGIWADVLLSKRGIYGVMCRFQGEEAYQVMRLPEGQEAVIKGNYDHGSENRAYLRECSLISP